LLAKDGRKGSQSLALLAGKRACKFRQSLKPLLGQGASFNRSERVIKLLGGRHADKYDAHRRF
jgi:hypothetical protein